MTAVQKFSVRSTFSLIIPEILEQDSDRILQSVINLFCSVLKIWWEYPAPTNECKWPANIARQDTCAAERGVGWDITMQEGGRRTIYIDIPWRTTVRLPSMVHGTDWDHFPAASQRQTDIDKPYPRQRWGGCIMPYVSEPLSHMFFSNELPGVVVQLDFALKIRCIIWLMSF